MFNFFADTDDSACQHVPLTMVKCRFCGKYVRADTAHRHDGGYVGDECCWDERLSITE